MNKLYRLSVTIITLNEADRIERCLESVKDLADEIIVFDCGREHNRHQNALGRDYLQ